ncbi:MAG: aldehyde dehydrogenase family protein, partial [Clostridia bacterium]|nr:aldehyde dehydrogenase family protein [Clostridia bacterium]
MSIPDIVERQREFFNTGATRSYAFRKKALEDLRRALQNNAALINQAIRADLNKQEMETYMTETGMVLEEIRFHLKHLHGWMKQKTVPTPMAQFHAKSFVAPEPYGVSLIISPWNYPVQLCLSPLVGAISGGNCAIVKPSAYTPATSGAIAKLLGDTFDPSFIAVVEGGRAQNSALLEQKFDYIFFTGSVAVGKVVMEAAARHLTPLTLELGGKSPVIVDETADIKLAARRIAFGKVLNAGQTCVAPDYLFIHKAVKTRFIEAYR